MSLIDQTAKKACSIPLVVDLDGSLLKTDLPFESFVFVLFQSPGRFIRIILKTAWHKVSGNHNTSLKRELEQSATHLCLSDMPWSLQFLQYLREEKKKRPLVLCTGSTQGYAHKVQNILGLFQEVWGSVPGHNLSGRKKQQFLVKKYGEKQFDYAGDAWVDRFVAPFARQFILVNPSFLTRILLKSQAVRVWQEKHISLKALFLFLAGPWCLLNTLVLFPGAVLTQNLELAGAWIFFNGIAAGGQVFFYIFYLWEDRKDLSSPGQKYNLLATGDLSLSFALFFISICVITGLGLFSYWGLKQPLACLPVLLYSGAQGFLFSRRVCLRKKKLRQSYFLAGFLVITSLVFQKIVILYF